MAQARGGVPATRQRTIHVCCAARHQPARQANVVLSYPVTKGTTTMADGSQSTELTIPAQSTRTVTTGVAAFDTGKFDQMVRIARMMALAGSTPDHIRGIDKDGTQTGGYDLAVANCFSVVEQAHRWDMSPFALVQCTYFVHGKIGF